MKNIFEDAKYNDKFMTKNFEQVTFVGINYNEDRKNIYMAAIEGVDGYCFYYKDGTHESDNNYDISYKIKYERL